MGGCSVAFCHNRFVRGTKHFFRFPKDWRRAIWIKFTLRKNNFIAKSSSTICEDHFMPELLQKKKDRVSLNKEAVPTIFIRDSERFDIRFDSVKREYEDEVSSKDPAGCFKLIFLLIQGFWTSSPSINFINQPIWNRRVFTSTKTNTSRWPQRKLSLLFHHRPKQSSNW